MPPAAVSYRPLRQSFSCTRHSRAPLMRTCEGAVGVLQPTVEYTCIGSGINMRTYAIYYDAVYT